MCTSLIFDALRTRRQAFDRRQVSLLHDSVGSELWVKYLGEALSTDVRGELGFWARGMRA